MRPKVKSSNDSGMRGSPLPKPEDLPVIVAVRMNLSFPALLSSIPLYAIDYTVSESHVARHRFSDGGITSNFPIHFFDAAVPGRPTFGINLVEVPEVYPDQERNVLLPTANEDDMQAATAAISSVPEFTKALLNTLQNWADSMQTRVPGYRGRIVAVNHTKNEGGMNLTWDPPSSAPLLPAASMPERQRKGSNSDDRWLRFRSSCRPSKRSSSLQVKADAAKRRRRNVVRRFDAGPPSYRSPWSRQRKQVFGNAKAAMVSMSKAFAAMGDAIEHDNDPIGHGAPLDPPPRLQVRPRPICSSVGIFVWRTRARSSDPHPPDWGR